MTSRGGWRVSTQFAPWVRGTSIPAGATLRQDCDEPHPEADKLLIRPTHDGRVRRRQQRRTSPTEGTIHWADQFSGHVLATGTSLGRRAAEPVDPHSQSVLTGTTSHQHYRPPHQPPGHDLVIDLRQARGKKVLTGSGLGQQNASTMRCCSPIRGDERWEQADSNC